MLASVLFSPLMSVYFGSWICLLARIHGTVAAAGHQHQGAKAIDIVGDQKALHVLISPPDPCVDIVAVHGLDGHWERSWTAANGVFWLRDLLPSEIHCARVFSYSHDSRTRGSDVPLTSDISDHGEALVADLCMERKSTETERLPIIFVGHSLGGVIIKSALLYSDLARLGHLERYRSIKLSTYAVFFLGTPHQGGEGVPLIEIIRKISSTVSYTNKKLLEKMGRNSEWLLELQSRYNSISQDFETTCFYETLAMPLPIGKLLIVPKHSAVMFGAANAEAVPMRADHSTIAKFETSNDQGFQKIVRRLRLFAEDANAKIGDNWMRWQANKDYQSHSQRLDPKPDDEFNLGVTFANMRNPHFTGREKVLQTLASMLHRASDDEGLNLVVLYGAGGMGKTQTAHEYIHRSKADYTSIFWIDGARNYSAANSISMILEGLKRHYEIHDLREKPWYRHIEETLEKESRIAQLAEYSGVVTFSSLSRKGNILRDAFLSWLSSPKNCGWLMIIDNVDDLESFDFHDWLPPTLCGSLIITTRRQELAKHWKCIEIDRMTDGEAMTLLGKTGGMVLNPNTKEWFSSINLIDELGRLPLAISQVGAHIAMSHEYEGEPVGNYLTLYKRYPLDILATKATEVPWELKQETVFTTWEVSFNTISDRDPLAARILLLCGYLAPEHIMEDIFTGPNHTDFKIDRAFRTLVSYSLLKESRRYFGKKCYSMHPLIHLWVRDRMDDTKKRSMARQVVIMLQTNLQPSAGIHVEHIFSTYPDLYPCQRNISHIMNESPCPALVGLQEIRQHSLVSSPIEGWLLWLRGVADKAWSWPNNYLDYGDSPLSDWELIYAFEQWVNVSPGALSWALCHALKTFPPKHPRILEMIGSYANSLTRFGHHNEAAAGRSWSWWLLLARIQVLGRDHPATAGALLGIGMATDICIEKIPLMATACDLRFSRLGIDDVLTRNALGQFARAAYECYDNAIDNDLVFDQVSRLVNIRGKETAEQYFGPDIVASYTMRIQLENVSSTAISRCDLLPPLLDTFVDMGWILQNGWAAPMASDLFNASKRCLQTDSFEESAAAVSLRPHMAILQAILDPGTEHQDAEVEEMLFYPREFPSFDPRWIHAWPKDRANWRLLLPLVRGISESSPVWCGMRERNLQGAKIEQPPGNQLGIYEWLEPFGRMLLHIKLFFSHCAGRWVISFHMYINAPQPLDRSNYMYSHVFWRNDMYICEEELCKGRLLSILVLTGRLSIDGKFNFLDTTLVHGEGP